MADYKKKLRQKVPYLLLLVIAIGAIAYYLIGHSTQYNTRIGSGEGRYVGGEYWVNARLLTESLFEADMPWDFGGFGYQPIMRIIYEIPWENIPSDVPYVWLNVTLPTEAINRILAIINKMQVEHNNAHWISTVLPYQVIWAKRVAAGNWQFFPVRSIMVAQVNQQGIPTELHVQVDRDTGNRYLVIIIPTPYTISFEDMIGQIPSSGTFYGWNVQTASNVYVRFAKDTYYYVGTKQCVATSGDNRVLFIDRDGRVIMDKTINFDLAPSKKYPVAWDIDLVYTGCGAILGHTLVMIILQTETQTGKTLYVIFPISTRDAFGGTPNIKEEVDNYLGATANYCLLPVQPYDAKFDLWEAIYNYCGADYYTINRIKRIIIWAKSYGGVGAVKYIMFGHPDFLNVTNIPG